MGVVRKKLYRPLQLITPYLHMKFQTNNLSGSGITSWRPYSYFGNQIALNGRGPRKSVPVTITHQSLPVYKISSQYLRQFRNCERSLQTDHPTSHSTLWFIGGLVDLKFYTRAIIYTYQWVVCSFNISLKAFIKVIIYVKKGIIYQNKSCIAMCIKLVFITLQ